MKPVSGIVKRDQADIFVTLSVNVDVIEIAPKKFLTGWLFRSFEVRPKHMELNQGPTKEKKKKPRSFRMISCIDLARATCGLGNRGFFQASPSSHTWLFILPTIAPTQKIHYSIQSPQRGFKLFAYFEECAIIWSHDFLFECQPATCSKPGGRKTHSGAFSKSEASLIWLVNFTTPS